MAGGRPLPGALPVSFILGVAFPATNCGVASGSCAGLPPCCMPAVAKCIRLCWLINEVIVEPGARSG